MTDGGGREGGSEGARSKEELVSRTGVGTSVLANPASAGETLSWSDRRQQSAPSGAG